MDSLKSRADRMSLGLGISVPASTVHVLKLERYRADQHGFAHA